MIPLRVAHMETEPPTDVAVVAFDCPDCIGAGYVDQDVHLRWSLNSVKVACRGCGGFGKLTVRLVARGGQTYGYVRELNRLLWFAGVGATARVLERLTRDGVEGADDCWELRRDDLCDRRLMVALGVDR